ASGVLQSIKVAEDETVEVGVELAVISENGEGATAQSTATPAQAEQEEQEPEQPDDATQQEEPEQPQAAEQSAAPEQPQAEEAAPVQQRAEEARPEPSPQPVAAAPTARAPAPPGQAGDGGGDASYVTPLVRRLAAEQGVDLAAVSGTGVGGRIRKQDVLDAARAGGARAPAAEKAAPTPAPAARAAGARAVTRPRGRTEKMSRLRGVIAARMVDS